MSLRVRPLVLASSLLPIAILVACGLSSSPASAVVDSGVDTDGNGSTTSDDGATQADAAVDSSSSSVTDAPADVDKSATCAATFGTALTAAFGRIDGTVVAVVPPNDQMCAAPNSTHLVIQVKMGGAVYRLVVDVLSNTAPTDVYFYEMDAPLPVGDAGGVWADGWHTGIDLDYVTTLNIHSTPFVAMHEADLVAKITSEIDLGAKISIFATSGSTEPDSAHLVHRNLTNQDGAIVIHPDAATPHWMLMRFNEQSF
jgi:hypothetical protein